jgi:integrase
VKPVTYESYCQLTRKHVIPSLGRNKLGDLTPEKIRSFRGSKLAEGLSTRTVQYLLVLLRKALQQAVEDGHIPRNVAQGGKVSQAKEEIRPLSTEQAKTLLAAARGTRLEALYVLAVHLGLRQGELLGLRWADIDFQTRTLSVKRTLSGIEGGRPVFGTPKTAKSRRNVKLTTPAMDALQRHRETQDRERSTMGSQWKDNGLVFRSTTGTPVERHNFVRRSFKPLLERAGLPRHLRFHDLRHTCATILLSKGKHPKYVQALLGHANVAITLDTYSHVLPGMDDGLTEAMEDALS